MTAIPATHAGGGVLTYRYYVNDQVRTIAQGGVSKTYALDPVGRQRQTVANHGTTHTGRSITERLRRPVLGPDGKRPGPGGLVRTRYLAAVRDVNVDPATDETVLHLSNLHGDTIATASLDPQATELLYRFESDEFGNPRQTAGADKRFGWLGANSAAQSSPPASSRWACGPTYPRWAGSRR
jgi:hypothetical protein